MATSEKERKKKLIYGQSFSSTCSLFMGLTIRYIPLVQFFGDFVLRLKQLKSSEYLFFFFFFITLFEVGTLWFSRRPRRRRTKWWRRHSLLFTFRMLLHQVSFFFLFPNERLQSRGSWGQFIFILKGGERERKRRLQIGITDHPVLINSSFYSPSVLMTDRIFISKCI